MSEPNPPTLSEVCKQALALPCSPTLLPELMGALRQDEGTAGEIERIIQKDTALAAATLRLANSAYFGLGEPIGSLEEAIVLLGHREIYRIASLALVSRWESVHREALPWEPGDYARHTLCTAIAAEAVAEIDGRGDPEVAYTAGLLCDIGKLVLAYACARHYPRVSGWAERAACSWEEAEKAVLGYHQTEVGVWLLKAWRFPETFWQAVAMQYDPERAPERVRRLAAYLHAAKFLAVTLGPGVTEGGYLFVLHGEFLSAMGLTTERLERAMIDMRDRAQRRLGARFLEGMFRA